MEIACDRKTPCSNCTNARLNCTHSTIATRNSAPKPKLLSSEHKITEIAEAVDGIKQLLQGLNIASLPSHDLRLSQVLVENSLPDFSPASIQPHYNEAPDYPLAQHSVQVGQFVNEFLEGGIQSRTGSDDAFISLRDFVKSRERRTARKNRFIS